jgi:flavin reductase (DIM6/NTAB) family NADH-FMN oxidoreductase RutF
MSTLDPKDLRRAFGRFMTGVTVVTGRTAAGEHIGFTANSFTSVSMDPPMLLVCPGNHLSSFDEFAKAEHFAVSVLAEGQEDISNRFAKSGADRFAAGGWSEDANGCALIDGRAAGFSCRAAQRIPAGDHLVLMGEVTAYDHEDTPGLGYGQGGYFTLSDERQAEAAAGGARRLAQVILERDGQIWLTPEGELPTVALQGSSGARTALEAHLETLGIEAALGPVFSVYDDAGAGSHHVVLRGRLGTETEALKPVPLDALPPMPPVQSTLLQRFAQEHRHQSFGLYIGDAAGGDIHTTDKG